MVHSSCHKKVPIFGGDISTFGVLWIYLSLLKSTDLSFDAYFAPLFYSEKKKKKNECFSQVGAFSQWNTGSN